MKPLLTFIPVLLLLLVNSCAAADPPISNDMWTVIASTETARAWTAVPTQTFNPYIAIMVNWLNNDLMSSANSLGSTMDAKYIVTNITFPNLPDLTFRVDVGCICMNNANCCIPERTFVVILDSLKKNYGATLAQVPSNVSQMMVVCSDKANSQIGSISASWQNVQGYLRGEVSGYQLGVQITRTIAP